MTFIHKDKGWEATPTNSKNLYMINKGDKSSIIYLSELTASPKWIMK